MQEVYDRLARVETNVDNMAKVLTDTAADVRAIRDHMIAGKARRRMLATLGAIATGAAGLYVALGKIFS